MEVQICNQGDSRQPAPKGMARHWIWAIVGMLLIVAGCQRQPSDTTASGNSAAPAAPTSAPSLEQVRAIAKEAYIYGFPMVDSYRIQHSYFVDTANPEYKGAWNQVHNTARVYTPDDKAIQTPNSDTPYSQLGVDLRTEPLVITVPPVAKGRYFSAQFIDMYTYNFAYVGTRATGNDGGSFLLAGPGWKGETPPGIKDVIRSETELAFILFRTQLLGADDIDNVKKIQAGYKVQPLSAFLGTPAPPPAPAIDFIAPLTPEQQKTSPEFFAILNFLLQFAPTDPSEVALRERFASIGIEPGKPFDVASMPADRRQAIQQGMADAWKAFSDHKTNDIDTGKASSADSFGTREYLKNNYMERMSGAVLGIYGNSKDEALYPAYFVDSSGQKLDGRNRYTLRFAPGQLPPVDAFWSATMYELPSSLLVANPLDRYLINSAMLPSLQKDADGGITLYLQHESPGKARESNWLPAPAGPFLVAMRLYQPKAEALDGRWKAPALERTP